MKLVGGTNKGRRIKHGHDGRHESRSELAGVPRARMGWTIARSVRRWTPCKECFRFIYFCVAYTEACCLYETEKLKQLWCSQFGSSIFPPFIP
jgi:hypothetical protein